MTVRTPEPTGSAILAEPIRRHVAALILDVSGFTEFVEMIEPEVLFQMIRGFHAVIGAAVTRGSGTVVNYAGDAMLVVFNGPIAVPDPERRAARTALEMRDAFLPHAANWSKQGYRLGLRIGIAAGFASLGMIGYPGRFELGVLGRTVNMAGRLCTEATIGSIFTSERVAHDLEGMFDLRPVANVMLRGFSRPVSVVEVVGHRDSPPGAHADDGKR